MLKILTTLAMLLGFTASAVADYTFIVPQKPGGGTSVWAQIVATEMEKYLDEKIVIKHIRGARDIPGFNKWHNDMRDDDKVVMVSHGGNGVSFLNANVDYNYNEYDSVGLMNLNIIVAARNDHNTYGGQKTAFAAGSGMIPEGIAMTLLKCGSDLTVDQYIDCFKRKVNWVKGMSGGERRLAFKRGELDGTRENPAAFKKHVQPSIDKGIAGLWFHHGILQADGTHADDPNYPGIQMEKLFYAANRVEQNGDLYDAYKLVKSFRDGMQKALWVAKGNPNKAKLIAALEKVATTPESIAAVQAKVGKYQWLIGSAGDAHRDTLMKLITPKALSTLVKFNNEAFGIKAVYKDTLVAQK